MSTRDAWHATRIRDDISWQNNALCHDTNPELFFARTTDRQRDAIKFCLACPVRLECLGYALRNDETNGIWGGTTETERRRLKRGAA